MASNVGKHYGTVLFKLYIMISVDESIYSQISQIIFVNSLCVNGFQLKANTIGESILLCSHSLIERTPLYHTLPPKQLKHIHESQFYMGDMLLYYYERGHCGFF